MRGKGQVTGYIILGIVLLILVGGIFFIRQKSFEDVDVLDYSPEDLSPIEAYLVGCLSDSARQALLVIGMQGGYINLPEEYYGNPKNYVQTTSGGMKVPLWQIEGKNVVPDLELVELQLEDFVEDDIKVCINSLQDIDSVGNVNVKSLPKVNVSINQEDVSFILNYEIEAEFERKTVTYNKFGVRFPLKLFDILKTANYLVQKNTEDMFLADATVNILAMDPDIPLGDIKFDCGKLRWSKYQIKQHLQELLKQLITTIRVEGTDFMAFSEPIQVYEKIEEQWDYEKFERDGLPKDLPADIYEYLHQFWKMDHDFNGLNVGFSYDERNGMDLQVSPSDGDRLDAEAGRSNSKYLKYLCFNIYHFTYDISYPVVVTLYDGDAFLGDGYAFSFAMPVFVEKNIPKSVTPNFFLMDARETDETFCSDSVDEVNIQVKDYYTGEYLSNVDISYDCVMLKCDLGEVSSENSYNIPMLRAKVPRGCYNGFYIAEKPGYLRLKTQLETSSGGVELTMKPLKDLSFGVYQLIDGLPKPYSSNYRASVYINAKNSDFTEYYTYPVLKGQSNIMQLLNGPETYELEIYLYEDDNLVGGYVDDWDVTLDDLASSSVAFYAKEFVDMVGGASTQRIISMYEYLEDDPETISYRQKYYPEFR